MTMWQCISSMHSEYPACIASQYTCWQYTCCMRGLMDNYHSWVSACRLLALVCCLLCQTAHHSVDVTLLLK